MWLKGWMMVDGVRGNGCWIVESWELGILLGVFFLKRVRC